MALWSGREELIRILLIFQPGTVRISRRVEAQENREMKTTERFPEKPRPPVLARGGPGFGSRIGRHPEINSVQNIGGLE